MNRTKKCPRTLLFFPSNSKHNGDIENDLSGIMENALKFPLIYSVERIRWQHFTHLSLKSSKDSSPMLTFLPLRTFFSCLAMI